MNLKPNHFARVGRMGASVEILCYLTQPCRAVRQNTQVQNILDNEAGEDLECILLRNRWYDGR